MSQPFENRVLVVPGDMLSESGFRPGENTYRLHGKIHAARVGLVEYNRGVVSVIALKANYEPKIGETVIGSIAEIDLGSWRVDIEAPSQAVLNLPDAIGEQFRPEIVLPNIFELGDTIVARIVSINRDGTPVLTTLEPGLGKVEVGRMVRITSSKIPRLIGKRGSMVNMILKETGCQIIIGQNGIVLLNCKDRQDEQLVVQVLQKIESEAHTTGLTNRVYEYIREMKEKSKK